MKIYHWDFWGPTAERTAKHHREHVEEFCGTNQLAGCETGVEALPGGGHSAWCKAPPEAESVIERALRPRRVS